MISLNVQGRTYAALTESACIFLGRKVSEIHELPFVHATRRCYWLDIERYSEVLRLVAVLRTENSREFDSFEEVNVVTRFR